MISTLVSHSVALAWEFYMLLWFRAEMARYYVMLHIHRYPV